MVIASFWVASAAVVVLLLVMSGFNRATYRRGRLAMARELGGFLEEADALDRDHGTGRWDGMPVRIAINHDAIDFAVVLPDVVVPYGVLLARYGGEDLAGRIYGLGLSVDGAGHLIGSVAREAGLAESLVSVETRIAVAGEVRALRRHVPRELVDAIDRAQATAEIDELLLTLATHFPTSELMAEGIERAVLREPHGAARIRAWAATWLSGRAQSAHIKAPSGFSHDAAPGFTREVDGPPEEGG